MAGAVCAGYSGKDETPVRGLYKHPDGTLQRPCKGKYQADGALLYIQADGKGRGNFVFIQKNKTNPVAWGIYNDVQQYHRRKQPCYLAISSTQLIATSQVFCLTEVGIGKERGQLLAKVLNVYEALAVKASGPGRTEWPVPELYEKFSLRAYSSWPYLPLDQQISGHEIAPVNFNKVHRLEQMSLEAGKDLPEYKVTGQLEMCIYGEVLESLLFRYIRLDMECVPYNANLGMAAQFLRCGSCNQPKQKLQRAFLDTPTKLVRERELPIPPPYSKLTADLVKRLFSKRVHCPEALPGLGLEQDALSVRERERYWATIPTPFSLEDLPDPGTVTTEQKLMLLTSVWALHGRQTYNQSQGIRDRLEKVSREIELSLFADAADRDVLYNLQLGIHKQLLVAGGLAYTGFGEAGARMEDKELRRERRSFLLSGKRQFKCKKDAAGNACSEWQFELPAGTAEEANRIIVNPEATKLLLQQVPRETPKKQFGGAVLNVLLGSCTPLASSVHLQGPTDRGRDTTLEISEKLISVMRAEYDSRFNYHPGGRERDQSRPSRQAIEGWMNRAHRHENLRSQLADLCAEEFKLDKVRHLKVYLRRLSRTLHTEGVPACEALEKFFRKGPQTARQFNTATSSQQNP